MGLIIACICLVVGILLGALGYHLYVIGGENMPETERGIDIRT